VINLTTLPGINYVFPMNGPGQIVTLPSILQLLGTLINLILANTLKLFLGTFLLWFFLGFFPWVGPLTQPLE